MIIGKKLKKAKKLYVYVTTDKIGEKSFVLNQVIHKSNGEIAVNAKVVMVAIDPVIRKSTSLPDELKTVLKTNFPAEP